MFKPLDPLLHNELRLAVMSLLISADEAEFTYIRKQTNATAGNLSVQIDKLSAAGYIDVEKTFKGKRPCTICRITTKGQQAFEAYVDAIKNYLNVDKNGL
ncbi:MAG: transcriptional regulator [Bacteroidaceae bacterium]|nr:transcriptional regulator [Bacteroidaceae bacterium]